jgi:hypothetical protein
MIALVATAVECPRCLAAPQKPCRSTGGKARKSHPERRARARTLSAAARKSQATGAPRGRRSIRVSYLCICPRLDCKAATHADNSPAAGGMSIEAEAA